MANNLSTVTFPATEFGNPTASAPGDTGSAGTAATLARSDHRHAREAGGVSSLTGTDGVLVNSSTGAVIVSADNATVVRTTGALKVHSRTTAPPSPAVGEVWVDQGATSATSSQNFFVGPNNPKAGGYPNAATPTYLWVQTGLGPSGTDFTLWIEDGT